MVLALVLALVLVQMPTLGLEALTLVLTSLPMLVQVWVMAYGLALVLASVLALLLVWVLALALVYVRALVLALALVAFCLLYTSEAADDLTRVVLFGLV